MSRINQPLYRAFIAYKKAFDSVEILAVMKAFRNQVVDETYVKVMENIYRESTATIVLHRQSDRAPIKKGVRQGDAISPKLFTPRLQKIFRKLNLEQLGIRVNGEYFSNLLLADEIALLSNSGHKLKTRKAE